MRVLPCKYHEDGTPVFSTSIRVVKLALSDLEEGDRVTRWQYLNRSILALTPPRWASMNDTEKWVLLRILVRRGEEYVPDWIDPALWADLRIRLYWCDFNVDTDLLEIARGGNINMTTSDGRRKALALLKEAARKEVGYEAAAGFVSQIDFMGNPTMPAQGDDYE